MHMEACRHRREHGAVSGPHLKPGSGRPVPHPSTQTPPPPAPFQGFLRLELSARPASAVWLRAKVRRSPGLGL